LSRPFRYTFILLLVGLGACMAAVFGWRYARASAPVSGPIVLISVDALRADRLSAFNPRAAARTPALDSLARDGVVFERAYSHAPQTLPAHAALLSGRLPFETGVRTTVGAGVAASERMLPEMLDDRGFSTGGVVSSFLLRRETGIEQGFAFFDDALPASGPLLPGLARDGHDSVRVAETWLTSVGTPRAFLFLHLNDLHRPYSEAAATAGPPTYDARIEYVDGVVADLIRYLKTHQLYDQATVILVGDHGEGLGDHGELAHGGLLYDEALHVPLIIKTAAGEIAGSRVRTLVQHVDLVPTVLDLAKAPVPDNLRGRSLTPLIRGRASLGARMAYAESLYALQHFGWSAVTTLTDGRYRYIVSSREELYDQEHDPAGRENVATSHPKVVASFREALKQLSAGAPAVPSLGATDEEDLARYRVFGYVGNPGAQAASATDRPDPTEHWDVVEQYRLAVELEGRRRWAEAIDQFRALARRQPAMRDVWMLLAETASRADRFEIAVDAYAEASRLDPDDPLARLLGASALLSLRRYDDAGEQARHVLSSAVATPASRAAAHAVLARVALGRREAAAARAEAARAEQADPTMPVRAYVDGRLAFDRRQYETALAALETVLEASSPWSARALPDARLLAAESLLHLDRYSEAEYLFLEEMKLPRLNRRARLGLSSVYTATGRTDEAAALSH
jgi:tetratricopeptide (TPR) repeat protein